MVDSFRISRADEETRKFDTFAHAITTIDEPHRMVHDGFFYHASHRVASLSNAADHEILLAVPAATYPHFRASIITVGGTPCDFITFEGTTASADGTGVTAYNRNRNSLNAADMVVTHTPTLTADGTQIHDRLVPVAGKDTGSVSPNLGEEWILKPSTKYLIRVTNNSGAAIALTWEILWYELGYVA